MSSPSSSFPFSTSYLRRVCAYLSHLGNQTPIAQIFFSTRFCHTKKVWGSLLSIPKFYRSTPFFPSSYPLSQQVFIVSNNIRISLCLSVSLLSLTPYVTRICRKWPRQYFFTIWFFHSNSSVSLSVFNILHPVSNMLLIPWFFFSRFNDILCLRFWFHPKKKFAKILYNYLFVVFFSHQSNNCILSYFTFFSFSFICLFIYNCCCCCC